MIIQKIYEELVLIRKELQAIRNNLERGKAKLNIVVATDHQGGGGVR